jgi:hypothetical protein
LPAHKTRARRENQNWRYPQPNSKTQTGTRTQPHAIDSSKHDELERDWDLVGGTPVQEFV